MRAFCFLVVTAALSSGCALGAQLGGGMTVDTSGAIGVEVRAAWLGTGMTSNDRSGHEAAVYLLSLEGAAGYESRRGPYFLVAPGIGVGGQPGGPSGLGWHANFGAALGLDGSGVFTAGPSVRLSLLPVVGFSSRPPPDTRPEWAPTNTYHSFGGTFGATLLFPDHPERDPFVRFYLGPQYQFTRYVSVGL